MQLFISAPADQVGDKKKYGMQSLSEVKYKVDRIVEGQGNHYLQGGTDRTSLREELMYIPGVTRYHYNREYIRYKYQYDTRWVNGPEIHKN